MVLSVINLQPTATNLTQHEGHQEMGTVNREEYWGARNCPGTPRHTHALAGEGEHVSVGGGSCVGLYEVRCCYGCYFLVVVL